ncbi:uncharacterized protein TEOVI_000436600 [Trypanosoma equiperdum]|uniref:Uncharacterized protein n=2 Tax=Trypanozoon TaxID=39700 RepID=Q383P3_TRYB2|nr:hypothetical protein, conserved [Trypanosoma brucei brucei TREU927]EAN79988.1 hypothetical protein, conserved [Trypanosoma brucei brucei TREU927]SCU72782.1 hypothetical protein, conserved [Trypanosoma equiperdum]
MATTGYTLTERVEGIAFGKSALPAPPPPEKFLDIFSTLEDQFRDTCKGVGFLFGADSVTSNSNSVLVSNGWPPYARIASSFAAAAAHSELGKVLRWFAKAVVGLFVNGVKSGVGFPQQWDEYVRQQADLMEYRFELQGFGVLFTYILCQLAAVESAVSEGGVSGEYSPSEGAIVADVHLPDLGAAACYPETKQSGKLRPADGCKEAACASRVNQLVPRKRDKLTTAVGNASGPLSPLQPPARHSSATVSRTLERKTAMPPAVVSLGDGNVNGSLILGPSKSLLSPARGHMGIDPLYPQQLRQRSRPRSDTPPGCVPQPKQGGPTPVSRSVPRLSYSALQVRSCSPRDDVGDSGLYVGAPPPTSNDVSGLDDPSSHVFRRRREANKLLGDGDCGEQNGIRFSIGKASRVPPTTSLSPIEVQERMRASDLAKQYGVKSITNYAERDVENFKEQMKALRKLWEE